MAENISDISRAISDALTGAYASARITQETLAERAEMSIWTLQKKLRGRSPVSATDLVVISHAIGVDPTEILSTSMKKVEASTGMSEVPVSLDDHRKRRSVADMEEEEWEGERSAANTDPEIGLDEPEDT